MDKSTKNKLIKKHSPGSTLLKNAILAYIIGGAICALGQVINVILLNFGLEEKLSLTLVTVILIALSAFLTAVGVFDKIAKYAGAGTLVPVTGFSNAVTSQAMDAKSEGMVMGVGAKIFNVAGPVILYGLLSGVVYGVIYYSLKLFGISM